nr:putative reverse transcriptase domain-containing protein [Tanacetum cinerariifolium]
MIVSYFDKANVVSDASSRKERVKSRRVRGMILAALSEAFKQENVLTERLHGLDQQMERKGYKSLYFMDRIWVLLTLEDIMRTCVIDFGGSYHLSIRCASFEALYGRKCRLRLPEELNSVHDTFHVSNIKRCLADANLHVPLDEIKVDKTLRFVEEPVEIMDREIKKLKCRKIALVKVRWNSKCGPEFT